MPTDSQLQNTVDPLNGLNPQQLEKRLRRWRYACSVDSGTTPSDPVNQTDAIAARSSASDHSDFDALPPIAPNAVNEKQVVPVESEAETSRSPHAVSNETRSAHFNRRSLLKGGTALAAGLAVAGPLQALMANRIRGGGTTDSPYGAAVPVADESTGLELLQLPPGFRYRSFGWLGDPMLDGTPTPGNHDGMGVIRQYGPYLILARNHENTQSDGNSTSFVSGAIEYSPEGPGGCTNLVFNTLTGEWVAAYPTLSGTNRNCAGGPTPWGTWLTCEESFNFSNNETQRHGYVFEVGPFGSNAQPIPAMGRFSHEAVAFDPRTGIIYETEDGPSIGPFSEPAAGNGIPADMGSGFYRFIPNVPRFLRMGGKLQMARVKGIDNFDFTNVGCDGTVYDLEWVDIDVPDPDLNQGESSCFMQGYAKGGAIFRRLEGCWHGNGRIYVVSTDGGPQTPDGSNGNGEGIVFEYLPPRGRSRNNGGQLKVIYASPAAAALENPDNITVGPRGGLLLCEDNSGGAFNDAERLIGLTPDGKAFTFAVNNVNFTGSGLGPYSRTESGRTYDSDERQTEWAGATFSYDGQWLFVNIQDPGITFAITGPWENGPL